MEVDDMKTKIDPLDVLFSRVIRLRAGGKCEYCGKPKTMKQLQCSHFHGRRKRSVRWDLFNAAALDGGCHIYLGGNPYQHTEWFKTRMTSGEFEQLNIRAETIAKNIDKEALMAKLKEREAYYDAYALPAS